jgi:ribosomal protein S18 acetylase RimI-like enzyme
MIRPAQQDDEHLIDQLAHEFDIFSRSYAGVFRGFFANNRDSFVICVDDGDRRMGFAYVQWTGSEGDIQGVVVDPACRRKGVATQLLDHIEQVARDRGVPSLTCITAETQNPAALGCFTQRGYTNEGFCGTYPNGQRAVRLRRTLN